MKRVLNFVKATVVGGVWFLIPLVVVLVIFEKAHRVTKDLIAPIIRMFPTDTILGFGVERVLVLGFLVTFCFCAGVLAKTALAKKLVDWLEETLLSNLPGYEFLKGIGAGLVGFEGDIKQEVVLARIEEAWQIGFLMETMDDGLFAVFVPAAPTPWSGSVYFMTEDRLKRLKISQPAALKCLRRLGFGANELMREGKARLGRANTPP